MVHNMRLRMTTQSDELDELVRAFGGKRTHATDTRRLLSSSRVIATFMRSVGAS